ncbi:MAG: hypothetical protein H7281_05260 [Bacteriovorax sp.]|nr:hypothetical protein [Bacteriovorax sp.]
MKRKGLILGLLFLVSSCGSLKLSPTGCRSDGVWGDKIEAGKQDTELKFTEEYYLWNVDYEVRLKEFLKKRNIDCSEIKKLRVNIKSVFFVKRQLTVFILK